MNKLLTIQLILISLIVACEQEESDNYKVIERQNTTLLAIDPYLVRAIIFEDVDQDNMLDAAENYAITDSQGYVSYNPNLNIDYCDEESDLQRHCLQLLFPGEANIVLIGGYDTGSQSKYQGQLILSGDATQTDRGVPLIISPLSSVPELAARLGVDSGNNFLDLASNNDYIVFQAAISVSFLSQAIINLLADDYPQYGTNSQFSDNLGKIIFEAINDLFVDGTLNDINKMTTEIFNGLLDSVRSKVETEYKAADVSQPSSQVTAAMMTRATTNVPKVLNALPEIISQSTAKNVVINSIPKVVVIFATKAVEAESDNFSEDVDFVGANLPLSGSSEGILDILAQSDYIIEISELSHNKFSDVNVSNVVLDDSAKLPELDGKRIDLSLTDSEFEGRLIIDFASSADNAQSGTLNMCARLKDVGDTVNKNLQSDGIFLQGSWEFFTTNQLINTVTVADTVVSFIIKRLSGSHYQVDYDGELRNWNIPDSGTLMTTPAGEQVNENTNCQSMLQ